MATEAARQHLARLGYEIPPSRRPEPDMPGLWEGPPGLPEDDGPEDGPEDGRDDGRPGDEGQAPG